jgi:hypothetical protein
VHPEVWITLLTGVFALPVAVNAQNVGHIFLPDGTCQKVGSVKEAPLVGADRTQIDLVPETANPPRDEYGTSFVGFWGRTPIFPGRCPVVTAVSSISGHTRASASSGTTSAGASAHPTASGPSSGPSGHWVSFGPKKRR